MTTPLGVPNLPLGALTVETLAEKLQDQTQLKITTYSGKELEFTHQLLVEQVQLHLQSRVRLCKALAGSISEHPTIRLYR